MNLFLTTSLWNRAAAFALVSACAWTQSAHAQHFDAGGKEIEASFGQQTDVVFHFKALLYPGRSPFFRLIAEDGTVFTFQTPKENEYHLLPISYPKGLEPYSDPEFGAVIDPIEGWTQAYFERVPIGTYAFEAYSTKDQLIYRLADIEVTFHEEYGCYPPQLQGLELEEQDFIRLAFRKPSGDFMKFGRWGDHLVRLLKQTEHGFDLVQNRNCEEEWIRVSNDYIAQGYLLLLPRHHPIALDGLEDGEVIELELMPFVHLDVSTNGNWPPNCYYSVYLDPPEDERNLLHHQLTLNFGYGEIADTPGFYFPEAGKYSISWLNYLPTEHFDPQNVHYGLKGKTVILRPSDPPDILKLTVPDWLKVNMWVRYIKAPLLGPPVIKMQAAEPPSEDVPRPPPPGLRVGLPGVK